MPRRRRQSVLEDLMELPWWVSAVAAAVVYGAMRFILPAMLSGSSIGEGIAQAAREHAWMFGVFFLIPAPIAALRRYRRKKLFDSQPDIESIRALSWREFEKLIAEAFRRMGYTVREGGGASPDGVDLVATAPDEKVLVQCKNWRTQSVGVTIVREHYGVMMHERATGGAIVATGTFTPDAVAFAEDKPIQLIDGPQLETLVLSIRAHVARPRRVLPPPV